MEGYTDAAAKFAAEANIPLRQDEHAIKARQEIKTLIHQGDIRKAVEALNGLDPQVCWRLRFSEPAPAHTPSTMIRTRVYMHHAYDLRIVDDKQPLFS